MLLSAEATVKWRFINVVAWHASMGNTQSHSERRHVIFHVLNLLFIWGGSTVESVNGKLDLYSNWHYFLKEQRKSFFLSLLLAVSLMWFSFLLLFSVFHTYLCCESCSSVAVLLWHSEQIFCVLQLVVSCGVKG